MAVSDVNLHEITLKPTYARPVRVVVSGDGGPTFAISYREVDDGSLQPASVDIEEGDGSIPPVLFDGSLLKRANDAVVSQTRYEVAR